MKTWLTEKINKPVLSHIRILSMECPDGAVVRRLFVFLKENLIFDHLLDELIQRDILNKRDIDDYICNGNCKCFKIERLIKRIIWKKRCSDFVTMMNEMPGLENIAEIIRNTKENTLWTVEDEMQGNHVLTTNDEMLQKHFAFLYMKLEPREVAHLLFKFGHISVDEHDEVIECNRKIGRLKSLLAILKKDKLYTHFVCTLQFLKCNSVLETLQRNEQLESHIGEYELYIQHNFILLQTELPDPDLAKVMMEHELDKSNISDIESCGGKTRQISKLLKILLMKGTPSCKELLRVIKFDLEREELIQRLKDISTDKKKRGKPDLCPERRSLNISWLQENEEVIISELDPLYVCDLLFEDRAIEIIEHDTITELKLRKEQVRNLLETVKENKNDLFHFFLYILQNVYNSIGKKHEKSVQAAESSENIECSASHGLRKLPGKPDDVQNELIEVKLKADHGSQGEQVLQNIHHSTGISEESISCGQMYVEKVSKGSVVLQLRPVTDQAVKMLLNARKNNRLVEMITGMLQKADIAKIMDGTMPFEITVQVKYAKPENAKSVKEISRTALIKHRMKANKNVLVYELESTALVSVLRDSKAFDKLAIEFDDKVTNNDDRVETLLSLVDNGNSDVVEEFLSALKDLNYCHIVELIDPADIHTKAELIREKITSNYKNILEEMQFTFAREVLSRCIGDVDGMGKKILPKNGNRRERMSTFLQFILQEDNNVIEFENILKNNGLGDLLKMGETIQREHTPAQDIEVTVVKDHIPSSLEEVLFESVITLSFSNIDKANKQNLGVVSGNTSVGDQLQKNDTEKSQSPIDNQTTHLQGSLSEHKMTTLSSDSQIDWALLEVQKGYLFMLEHIHEEPQLVGYLCHLCESPLSGDEKIDIRDGNCFFKMRELLKCLISKGESACKEFLEKFKCYQNLYSKFRNAVKSVTNADGIQQDVFLTHDKLPHFGAVLLEEMEPTPVADILYCHAVLSSDEHDEINEMSYRREKAMKLFTKIRQQPDKIAVFCHALEQSKCSRAIEYIRKITSNDPLDFSAISAVKCVRFNFRKNLEYLNVCESKKKLVDYLEINRFRVTRTGELVPKESYLIKTGIRNGKPWCDCILECIKQTDFVFLKKLVGRLEKRRKDGREQVCLQFDVNMMKDMKDFLLDELEPAPISHVLLEEEAFSADDHDEVENTEGRPMRKKKAEALCGILLRDGSELTMESFLYAVRKNQYIMNEIRRRQSGQQPITQQRPTNQSDIQIRHIGRAPENVEEIQAASGLKVVVSIPVQVVGDVEGLQQTIYQLNIDTDFQAEVAMASHIAVRSISSESVVCLILSALSDDASKMLFDENGEKMKTLIETFLRFSNIKEDMIKGNIEVTVSVPKEDTGNKLPTDDEIKIRGNWNLLVEELEPSIMAKKLFEKHVFNKDDTQKISSMKTRKEKVETLLRLLLSKQREVENAFDAFIRSLDEFGKGDIAVKIKPSEKMHQEAEKVRLGLLSKFAEAVDEIESSHMEETFELCGIDKHSVKFISSESGKSRKDRALQFLTYVLLNDAYVLGIEKVLNDRGLTWLLEYPKDRNFADQLTGDKHKRTPGEALYQCQYEVERKEMRITGDKHKRTPGEVLYQCQCEVKRKKMRIEGAHMTQKAESSEMDWEPSYCDMEIQTDVPKPKYYAPKKRLDPKPRPVRQAQVAVPKRIYGRPCEEGSKENEEEWPVVVALDFGTTYSGYAFWRKENPSEITTGKWNTGSKEVLESLKTPTSLLLNQKNEVIEFGYKAEKIFKELAEDDDKGYRYFCQFKMMLHNDTLLDEKKLIPDHLTIPLEALEVFSLSIRDLRDECFRDFENKRIKVDPDEILWILTVPAIWGESAKQFMRKAAEKAGIPSVQLKLALEPEAAAIYVMKEAKTVFGKESVTTFNPGTKIMVADLGGGTADLTVLEVKKDRKMKQLHQSAGGAWGGNLINKKIWEIMAEIFGSDVIEDFKKLTSDFMEMESIIELKKRDITVGSKLEIPIFPSLPGLCKQDYKTLIKNSKYGNSVKARTGKLRFEPDMVQKIFDLTYTNLFTVVKKVLDHENAVGVKDIILVGGFAQADIIVKQFEEKFSGYNIIIPTDPVLAVLKGAVMFGQDNDIISSRINAHTYGFDAMRFFMHGDPRGKKRKVDNVDYCVEVFEKMVAIGDSVDVGKTVEKEVFASSKEMKSMILKFYQSEIKNPKYVTDPGCKCIGKLSVEMPDLSGGTERSVIVSIKFGETEITVCGVDKTTGKRQETMLNLLGGETD